jgi:hypothetical protein
MGVVATVFKFLATDEKVAGAIGTAIPGFLGWNFRFSEGMGPELLALGAYVLLAVYMYWDARRTNGEA